MVAPPCPRQGMAAEDDSVVPQQRHSDGANGASTENGMQSCCEYDILVPEELAGDPATAGTRVRGAVYGATRGTEDQGRTETETGDNTGQRALLARGMQEDSNEYRSPPKRLHRINTCGHRGGGWGVGWGPLTRQHMPTACRQGPRGDPQTRQHAPQARIREMEEEGGPPTQQCAQTVRAQGSEGATPTRPHATPTCIQGEEEEGNPPELQRAHHIRRQGREGATPTRQCATPSHSQGGKEEGKPPKLQCAHLVHSMQERNKGGPLEPEVEGWAPHQAVCTHHAQLAGDRGGGGLTKRRKGGHPPSRSAHPS